MGGKDKKDINDRQRQPKGRVDIIEHMFSLFCKICKILTRGIKAVFIFPRNNNYILANQEHSQTETNMSPFTKLFLLGKGYGLNTELRRWKGAVRLNYTTLL